MIIDELWPFLCLICLWCLKPKSRDEKNYGEIVAYVCGMCAFCLIVFLKSFVSCQALAEALKQNSAVTNLNLHSNSIGPDGAKAWCSARMGPDGVMTGRGIKAPPYESSSTESQRCCIFLVTTDRGCQGRKTRFGMASQSYDIIWMLWKLKRFVLVGDSPKSCRNCRKFKVVQ